MKSINDFCHCYYQYIELYCVHIVYYYGSRDKCIDTISKFLTSRNKNAKKEIVGQLKKYIGSPDNTSDYFCIDFRIDSEQWILICVGNSYNLDNPIQLGSISHECTHAAIFIAREHGFYVDEGNSEPIAYLQDYILSVFLFKLKKTKQKVSKNDNN